MAWHAFQVLLGNERYLHQHYFEQERTEATEHCFSVLFVSFCSNPPLPRARAKNVILGANDG
jgi:hypothetical protein